MYSRDTGPDPLFDLTPTPEQQMSRDSLARFAVDALRPAALLAEHEDRVPVEIRKRGAELGLAPMQVPERLGGAGAPRSPMSNTLHAEELGYGDMALALGLLSPTAVVNALLDAGTAEQRARLLPRFCTATFYPATIALMEPRAGFDPAAPSTVATRVDGGYALRGVKTMVPLGLDALTIVVIARVDGDVPAAFLLNGDSAGMRRTPERHMGLRTLQLARLELEDVRVADMDRLDSERFDLVHLLDLSRIGLCALTVGTCKAVLDYVRPYVNERVAFGEPISHRQSIAFIVADMAIELDAMRLMTWRAASRAERGLPCHEQTLLAHAFCARHAMRIGTDAVQLLGGHGFCREHPVEMWYRNLRAAGILEGVACV